MKKITVLLLAAALCMGFMSACNKGEKTEDPAKPGPSGGDNPIEKPGPNPEEIYAALPDMGPAEYKDDVQGYLIEGFDGDYISWTPKEKFGNEDWMYFANPDFAGDYFRACRENRQGVEGSVRWADESKAVIEVGFAQSSSYVESGTVDGSHITFKVDLASGELVYAKLQLMPDVPYVLSEAEMMQMAKVFARLFLDARFYYLENGLVQQ